MLKHCQDVVKCLTGFLLSREMDASLETLNWFHCGSTLQLHAFSTIVHVTMHSPSSYFDYSGTLSMLNCCSSLLLSPQS